MWSLTKVWTVLGIALLCMIVAGQCLLTVHYDTEVDGWYEDGSVHYSFVADYTTNYSVVSLDNGDMAPSTDYIACYDTDHVWYISDGAVENALTHLDESMSKNGLALTVLSSADVTAIMESELTSGEEITTCVIFLTGSLPAEMYDGTDDCTFIQWLSQGGRIVWGNGPLGSTISLHDRMEYVEDFSTIMFGTEDAVCQRACFDTTVHAGGLSDLLRVYYTECSFGIRIGIQEDQIHLDNSVDGYAAVTLMRYHGGTGQMVVFGGQVNHLSTDYVTQVLISGITYDTVVIDRDMGVASKASGELMAGENPTLVVTLGLMDDFITRSYRP